MSELMRFEGSEILGCTSDFEAIWYMCPGCDTWHHIPVKVNSKRPHHWNWDGDILHPTVSPSVKHTWEWGEERVTRICHYFIREGQIEYCGDCTHSMANKKMPLPRLDIEGMPLEMLAVVTLEQWHQEQMND